MAEAAVGAGLDLGGVHIGALVDLAGSIDGLTERLDKVLKAQEDYQRFGPIYNPIGGSFTTPGSGQTTFSIDLGGPSPMRRWELRQLIVGGVMFSSSVMGTAELYQSPTSAGTGEPPLANVEDQAAALPNIAFYSSGQVIVRNPNHLFIAILSPGASTSYTVGGEVLDAPDVPLRGFYGE